MKTARAIFAAMVIALTGCGPGAIHFMREGGPVADVPRISSQLNIKKLWRHDLGTGYSNNNFLLIPFVDGERVFAADPKGRVVALSAQTGKVLWKQDLKETLAAGVGFGNELVVVATREGEVVGLDGADGLQRWRQKVGAEVLAQPVIAGNRVVLRSGDGQVIGLDAQTGEVLWRARRSVPGLSVRGLSTPLVIDDLALVGFASGRLSAIDLESGKELWSVPIFRPKGSNEIDRLVDIDSDPYQMKDRVFIAGFQSRITALSLRTRTVEWESGTSTIRPLSALGDALVVTADDGSVVGLDAQSGALLWQQPGLRNRGVSGPLGLQQSNRLIVGDYQGNLFVMDGGSGELIGREKASGGAVLRLYTLDGADHFLSLSENGSLTAWLLN